VWQEVDINEIMEDYDDEVFDSADRRVRQRLSREELEDLPMEDENSIWFLS
jgi:hypothetical protein